jgi:CRISPR-associated protein Csx14
MAEASIPVDLFNPGQVFACLGFLEAAEILLGNAEGGFGWSDPTNVRFQIRADGDEDPVVKVLEFLMNAEVYSQAAFRSQHRTEKWQIPTRILGKESTFPYPDPSSPATLPAVLDNGLGQKIVLDYWGDETIRDNAKFWAGSGGYPGAALARDALKLVRSQIKEYSDDPFSLAVVQDSSFRFDFRRDYIPLDAGFSPNKHGGVSMVGYPLVEILAAIGLSNARPLKVNKLRYRYAVVSSMPRHPFVRLLFFRAALGCAALPFPTRRFRMELGWPGQENQARCITNVVEEFTE